MNARGNYWLALLFALALTACGGAAGAPTATPTQPASVQAVTPAVGAKPAMLESRQGTVIVEMQLLNLAEPNSAPTGQWAFAVALTESSMDAPPLAKTYDLKQLADLTGPDGQKITPVNWTVKDEGHMGHHLTGTLLFPGTAPLKMVRVVVREVGGVSERVFEWPQVP